MEPEERSLDELAGSVLSLLHRLILHRRAVNLHLAVLFPCHGAVIPHLGAVIPRLGAAPPVRIELTTAGMDGNRLVICFW
jgi:hypothetical protein